jgi:hypothetical protein
MNNIPWWSRIALFLLFLGMIVLDFILGKR